MLFSDGCELDYFTEGGAFSGTQTADVDVHWAGRDVFSADTSSGGFQGLKMFEWVYIIGCYLLLLSTRFFRRVKIRLYQLACHWPGYLSALGDCKVSVCILPCERIPQEGGMEAVSDNGNFERRTGDAVGFAEGLGQCAYLFL